MRTSTCVARMRAKRADGTAALARRTAHRASLLRGRAHDCWNHNV
ncbi:hypothetical protein HMPREF0762_01487 [Slackia exigua ATCC 700122]|uniref:Uncharacterized protein n=1 Tax=Slackia exigua (strain ATCC 700122 / DSM 15923 / CIP 105133 / JCM 11022 / KCTC 5966 / S-7) TaxID=649764 RepID=D0WI16_SLAES|nr:hypothetical protein HMPREF0762_01487 [Slackia exigua ATCC 700122]